MTADLLSSGRRVAALGEGRTDLLVHALAQLPDGVRLKVSCIDASSVAPLIRAYDLDDRVEVDEASSGACFVSDHGRTSVALVDGPGRDPGSSIGSLGALVEALRLPGMIAPTRTGDDAIFARTRIAWLTNFTPPYRVPLFERLDRRVSQAGGRLQFFLEAVEAPGRPWIRVPEEAGFEYEVMEQLPLRLNRRRPSVPVDLERRLRRFRPDLIVSAGLSPFVSGRAALWARRRNIAFVIITGDTGASGTSTSSRRRAFRTHLARSADVAIAYGYDAAEYFRSLAATPVVIGRNTSQVAQQRTTGRREDRAGPVRLLAVGDLTSTRKGIDVLVEALRLRPELACCLDVVGGGARLDELRARGVADGRIRFTGPLSGEEVLAAYSRAQVFLFPTRFDVYGLALVEAMGSGLAVLTSTAAGALGDLAVDGKNCIVVPNHDPATWAEALEAICRDPPLRRRLAARAADTVSSRWTLDHSADAMVAGMRLALRAGAMTREEPDVAG